MCGRRAADLLHVLRRVQGFPTIKAYVNGRMIDYSGDRSAGHLKDWAISLIPQKVRTVLTVGPQSNYALLLHIDLRECMQGCRKAFAIVVKIVLTLGCKLDIALQRCVRAQCEGEDGGKCPASDHEAFMAFVRVIDT